MELENKETSEAPRPAVPIVGVYSRFMAPVQRNRVRITRSFREDDGVMILEFTPKIGVEGPPGHCHGGFQAAILDECMGNCAWWNGHMVLLRTMETELRKSLPLGSAYRAQARVTGRDKRRIYLRAEILGLDGTRYASAKGLFMEVPEERIRREINDSAFEKYATIVEMRRNNASVEDVLKAIAQGGR